MTREEEFIQSLYDEANNQLKEVYKEQRENRDELLKNIALIILTYTVLNEVMSISKKDKDNETSKLSAIIISAVKGQDTTQNKVLTNILNDTIKKTFNFYSYNSNLKDVRKIIENNFKGKHFSERIWENEQEVAKYLHKQVKDFLNGKINVNQIKKDIEKTYNAGAYNAKRLAETEVNRCEDEAFKKFCIETGVQKIKRNEILDAKTCEECAALDGKIFALDDAPSVVHPLCRGFNTIEDGNKKESLITMDLQLFSNNNWKELENKMTSGLIEEDIFNSSYNEYINTFRNGVKTPIETINDNRDSFIHIAQRHPDMVTVNEVKNIEQTLKNPDKIFKDKDKNGIEGIGYLKNINDETLYVITRGDIITAYYPSGNYLKKIVGGELIWERK